ncbi:hypothetical protein LCGC14_1747780, partial [marine sediment metagenome]
IRFHETPELLYSSTGAIVWYFQKHNLVISFVGNVGKGEAEEIQNKVFQVVVSDSDTKFIQA